MIPGFARFAGAGRDLRTHGTLQRGQVKDGVHEGSHFRRVISVTRWMRFHNSLARAIIYLYIYIYVHFFAIYDISVHSSVHSSQITVFRLETRTRCIRSDGGLSTVRAGSSENTKDSGNYPLGAHMRACGGFHGSSVFQQDFVDSLNRWHRISKPRCHYFWKIFQITHAHRT